MSSENKKSILFVSIAFPPKLDPEAIQVARYFRYLAASDSLNLDVVTSGKTLWMNEDPQLQSFADGARQVIRVPIFEPKYLAIIINKFFNAFLLFPDTRSSFHFRWKRVVNELKATPDVVYARAFPLSSLLMGYKLAKYYDKPYVIHLSDPWVDSPLIIFRGLSRWFQKRWQKKCFTLAEWIGVASPRMLTFYQEKYPEFRDKFQYLPNVYDPADIAQPSATPADNTKLTLAYTGSLNGIRQPLPLMQALAKLHRERPDVTEKLTVHMVGPFDSNCQKQVTDANLPFVHVHGQVPFKKAQETQRNADVLLLIDSSEDDPNKALFFPSKILDYMVAQKPILSITPPNSTTREILAGGNYHHFAHHEIDGIANAIIHLLQQKNQPSTPAAMTVDLKYSAKHNAERLLTLLQQV